MKTFSSGIHSVEMRIMLAALMLKQINNKKISITQLQIYVIFSNLRYVHKSHYLTMLKGRKREYNTFRLCDDSYVFIAKPALGISQQSSRL